jgi:hypothetical protein
VHVCAHACVFVLMFLHGHSEQVPVLNKDTLIV